MRVLNFILQMSKPFRIYIWGIVLAMSCVALDRIIKPYLIKIVIDNVSQNDYSNIWIIVAIYAIVQAIMVWGWSFYDWCEYHFQPQLISHIVKELTAKVTEFPYQFFQDHLSGTVMSKISDAAKRTPRVMNAVLLEFFSMAVVIIVSIILLGTIHYAFALSMLVWVALFLTIMYFKMSRASDLSRKEAEAETAIGGLLVDYFSNIFAVKTFTAQKYESSRLKTNLDNYTNKSVAKSIYLRSYFVMQGIVFSIYIIGCLIGIIYLSKLGLITPGDFALLFMLNFEVVGYLFHIATLMGEFIGNCGAISQALTVLDVAVDVQDKPEAVNLQITQAAIDFEDVQFNYRGAQESLFKNKSVTIKPGEKVGLVGYSGGGKTTFINLILRLFDVTSGRILIDKQDIRDVTQNSLRASIGMIPQDPTLFHRTLFENIKYGNQDASEAEIYAAAKQAHADEFICKLPNGYQSLVGERGIKLSGGQRQRIAIARAILKNAPILILDEATSQLDSVTEQLIQDALWQLMQNKTTIIIAHRLSTLLRMDRILVFSNGKIVEDGKHADLLAQDGMYKTLWNAQVGGFLPDASEA